MQVHCSEDLDLLDISIWDYVVLLNPLNSLYEVGKSAQMCWPAQYCTMNVNKSEKASHNDKLMTLIQLSCRAVCTFIIQTTDIKFQLFK